MTDGDDFDDARVVIDAIEDAVFPDAQTVILTPRSFLEPFALGSRSSLRIACATRSNARSGSRSISFSADRLMTTV